MSKQLPLEKGPVPKTAAASVLLQRKSAYQSETVPSIVSDVLRSPGQPLDEKTRAFMEPRFKHDFSRVRVHTDAKAAESTDSINALAYTVGENIVFRSGQYMPRQIEGQRLLAHELAHVTQQNGYQGGSLKMGSSDDSREREAEQCAEAILQGRPAKACMVTSGEQAVRRQAAAIEAGPKPKIKYSRAKAQNIKNAKENALGWEGKLSTVSGGAYVSWADLWANKEYDAFADAVAEFQVKQGEAALSVDGILGLKSWSVIAGLAEAIAGIETVSWPESEQVCTLATRERILRGYQLSTGKSLELTKEERSAFNIILQSVPGRMLDVDEQYRGTGAAGAMVFAGKGSFVPESEIWEGKLTPGAVIQGWWNRTDYDLLRAGEVTEDGKKRRLKDSDLGFPAGTSMVFVRYDADSNEIIWVRHFGQTQKKSKNYFEVWIAANVTTP